MAELWKPISGYEGNYEVSNTGKVRGIDRHVRDSTGRVYFKKGIQLAGSPGPDGYPVVALWKSGKPRTIRIHTLVADAFVPGKAAGLEVCHFDGTRTNNNASNLRWDTRSGNVQDAIRHGTVDYSSITHCPHGHLYDDQNTILQNGSRVCRTCRNRLRRRRRAEKSVAQENRNRRDSEILRLRSEGLSQADIGEAVGMTQAGVSIALQRLGRAGGRAA